VFALTEDDVILTTARSAQELTLAVDSWAVARGRVSAGDGLRAHLARESVIGQTDSDDVSLCMFRDISVVGESLMIACTPTPVTWGARNQLVRIVLISLSNPGVPGWWLELESSLQRSLVRGRLGTRIAELTAPRDIASTLNQAFREES
jgi:hypothetical protein